MAKGDQLGEFEHLVMLAILRLKADAYGMQVRREIQSRTERTVTIGSVYATLDRLEAKGFVASEARVKPREGKSGRARKYFVLTHAGRQALLIRDEELRSMTEGLALGRELEAM